MQFLNTTNKYETSKASSSCNKNGPPPPKAMEIQSLWQQMIASKVVVPGHQAHLRPLQGSSAKPEGSTHAHPCPGERHYRVELSMYNDCTQFIKFPNSRTPLYWRKTLPGGAQHVQCLYTVYKVQSLMHSRVSSSA